MCVRAALRAHVQLMSSLVDAAERLRHFSPVKEQLSSAVLEEVRFRLYRIVSGNWLLCVIHWLRCCLWCCLGALGEAERMGFARRWPGGRRVSL